MAIISRNSGNFVTMGEGIHEATITSAEIKQLPKFDNPSELEDKLIIRYKNAADEEISGFYKPSLHEKANLTKVVVALRGSVPAQLDTKQLIGLKARVIVETGNNGKQRLTKVMKATTAAAKPKASAPKATSPKPAAPVDSTEITDDDLPF